MKRTLLLGLPFFLLARCGGSDPGLFDSGSGDGSTATDVTVGDVVGPCQTGQARCNGTCIDTTSDPKNCGGCGVACGDKEVCTGSACLGCDKVDNDKDGYNACVDCNDNDPNVNPGAFDVPGNNVDDDCNGKVDDVVACDTGITSNTTNALDFAHAMEMCDPWVVSAAFPTVADDKAHQVAPDWGAFKTQAGANMAALSNGIAADENDTGYVAPQTGTSFGKMGTTYPLTPTQFTCGNGTLSDPSTVNDLTELTVSLKVPSNANSFQIDVNYLTTDAPEWLCTQYDDQALVLLESKSLTGDILVDTTGRHMSVNSPYLVVNDATSLAGTGMELPAQNNQLAGGATGWMTVTAPATPGDTIKLRFIIFDSSDAIFDSQLLADHFRWSTAKVCGSTTVDPLYDGGVPEGGKPDGGC
jgi:hypothetical protein